MRLKFLAILILISGSLVAQTFLLPYRKGTLWGYADTTGKIVVAPQFDATDLFPQDFPYAGVVKLKDKEPYLGMIRSDGKIIVAPDIYRSFDIAISSIQYYGYPKTYFGAEKKKNSYDTYPSFHNFDFPLFIYGKKKIKEERYTLLLDSNGTLLNPTPFNSLSVCSFVQREVYFTGIAGNKYSILNQQGKEVIPPIYDSLECIHYVKGEYWISAKRKGKFGLLNMQHKVLLPFVYDELILIRHQDQYFLKGIQKDLQSLFDEKLAILQKPVAGSIYIVEYPTGSGKFVVKLEKPATQDEISMRDETGTIPPEMVYNQKDPEKTTDFSGNKETTSNKSPKNYTVFRMQNKYGILKGKKDTLFPAIYDYINEVFANNKNKDTIRYFLCRNNEMSGILNSAGNVVIPCAMKEMEILLHNWSIQEKTLLKYKNAKNKFGVVTLNNEAYLPFKYDRVELYNNTYGDKNKHFIIASSAKGTIVLDENKKNILKTTYKAMQVFDVENEALGKYWWLVMDKDNNQGIMKSDATIVLPVQFKLILKDFVYINSLKFADKVIYTNDQHNQKTYYDFSGKNLLTATYDTIIKLGDKNSLWDLSQPDKADMICVAKNGKYGLADFNGKFILPLQYDVPVVYLKNGYPFIRVQQNGQEGIATIENPNLIAPGPDYTFLESVNEKELLKEQIIVYRNKNKPDNNLGLFFCNGTTAVRSHISANYTHQLGISYIGKSPKYYRYIGLLHQEKERTYTDYISIRGLAFFAE